MCVCVCEVMGWVPRLPLLLPLLLLLVAVTAKKEDLIQDVTAKQLGDLTEEYDYVAVYWCEYIYIYTYTCTEREELTRIG